MSTLEIILPDPLREFVDAQVAAGRYPSASDFMRELVRDAQQRQDQATLEDALLQGVRSGPATPITDEDWDQLRRDIHSHVSKRHE